MATDTAVQELPQDIKELGDKIAELTLKRATQLSKYLEEEYGIKAAAAGVAMMPGPGPGAAPQEAAAEKTEWDVMLESFGEKKIGVIKVVRELTGLGLKEAKDLVEGVPSKVKTGLSKEDAEKAKAKLVEAGATVSIK